ncbi:hypothetical protein [Bacillus sp. B-jedd]|uniref:hypothetical protein n=1 Tax=Bacillus sp. B-jedd TaxID=1476857 RepID=UPI00051570F5|nr:hypothetical protein [Bacillus sp. B-jedd]CEG28810.1 hypothetical protein BN1002_03733 [Bacillus sp. B-jedd]
MRMVRLMVLMGVLGVVLLALGVFGFVAGFGILGGLLIEVLLRLKEMEAQLVKPGSRPRRRPSKAERASWVEWIETEEENGHINKEKNNRA